MMIRAFRVLALLVVGFSLMCWIPAGLSLAESVDEGSYSYEVVEDYWAVEKNGGGSLVFASGDLSAAADWGWGYGYAPGDGSVVHDRNNGTPDGNYSWGDEVDRLFVRPVSPVYCVWDLGDAYSQVVVFPSLDGWGDEEEIEYRVWGSNDFQLSNPAGARWTLAKLVQVYPKGWSDVGEDGQRYPVCNDDYVTVWEWPSAEVMGAGFRFVKLVGLGYSSAIDPEIDAVKGVLPEKDNCEGWETDVVEEGRSFSSTSLEVASDDRVHVAYGGEQLYYAMRDGSTWHVNEVDNGSVGAYCSLALNSLGQPAISYYDAANGDLKYAYKNGTLNDVWGMLSSDVYAVGDGGTVVRFDGTAWNPMYSGTTQALYGIWGSGWNWGAGDRVYAGGANGTMLRYNGSVWSAMSVPSGTPDIYGIWGLAHNNVYAVGAGGTILHYDGIAWTTMTSGTAQALRSIWGASTTNVFAVGDSGTIIRYDGVDNNGDGSLWDPMISGTSAQLSGVWGSSVSNVYAVGDGGVIRRYGGAGVNWSSVNSPVADCLGDIWGTSASDIFAVGCRGAVIHFGGDSWSQMVSDTTNRLCGVWGSSGGNVVAVGEDGAITGYDGTIWEKVASGNGWLTQTVDSLGNVGEHTSLVFSNGNPAISYYDVTNSSLKYAIWSPATGTWVKETVDSQGWVGEYSSLAFSNGSPAISYYDATSEDLKFAKWDGECWKIERIDTSGDVGCYTSLALDKGGNPAVSYYDATAGSVKLAYWNGSTWSIEVVDDVGWVGQHTCLAFDASNQPCISYYDALGQDLKFAHRIGMGWDVSVVDSAGNVGSHTSVGLDGFDRVVVSYYDATNEAIKISYRDSDTLLSGVWGDGFSAVFAVGDYGTIRQYKGQGWVPLVSGTSFDLNGVWGVSASDVYAVGDSGVILRYDGSIWNVMTSGTTSSLLGVWGRSATEIYAVGEGGTILQCNGATWSPMTVPGGMTRSLAGVWGAPSSLDVMAVGEYGTILRYNGSTWTSVASGTTQWLGSVWGESSSSIFAVGDRGTILYYDGIDNNGDGSLWDPMPSGTIQALRGVWGTSYSSVMVVGEQGTILRFDGSNWDADGGVSTEWLRGMWGLSKANVFAVGDDGVILRYSGASWSVMSTGEWKTETAGPYPWAGRFSSLGFDADNHAAISFYDGREGNLKYAQWDIDHWGVVTVDSYGDVGRYTSLAFDGSGNPCISYYDASRGNLKYACRNDSGGWVVSTPDSAPEDVGSYSSLAFDNLERPAISYYDATNQCLKYAQWNGTTWEVSRPDPALDDVGRYSSLAFDSDGNPAISYYDVTSRQLKCARRDGSVWNVMVVDRVGDWVEGEQAGGYCSLKFDCLDNPSISYFDATNGDLRYACWSSTGWEVQVVDSEGWVGMYTSLAFDGSKRPAISYHDGTKGTLKLARWNGKKWVQETMDVLQAAGHLTSLEFDLCGSPAVSYDSPITGDLKYASPTNLKPNQPVNKSPGHGTTYVSLAPALECEAFSDPCGDSQHASQWMITTENCDVNCSPVFNSGIDESNLVKIEVPSGVLEPMTTYYWCVRHQDCRGAWSPYSEKTAFTTASPPERPVNVSPANGSVSVSLTPALEASAFSDAEAVDRHIASQWQIAASSDNFSAPLLDRKVERTGLTQLEIAEGVLANRTTYYWRVRYQDNHGTWSDYSTQTSFTTNSAPDTPVNEQPSNGQGKVGLTPTLRSSTFADADVGESHLASQWRVTTDVDGQSVVVFDSGEDKSNLTELKVPGGTLKHDTVYSWQVRYGDSQGSWSSWSAETNFGTGAAPTVPAGLLVAAAAVAVVVVVAMTAPLVVPL